ncbi:MAG: transcription elongation factor GreA [Elusimicrobia bacterium]|nr:transcription elongation factor GreA [Elusimicrobiota bacterium]
MTGTYLSRAGYEKMVKELEALKKRRSENAIELEEARLKGDLKENGEYHAAKEKQAELTRRIHEMDDKLRKAQLTDDLKIKDGEVSIGVKVTLLDLDAKDEYEWTLVGQDESDPAKGMISVYSPLAQGILGKKVGDTVTVTLPSGPAKFKIVKTQPAL